MAAREHERGDRGPTADAHDATVEILLLDDAPTDRVVPGDHGTARLERLTAEIGELDAVPSAHQELGTEVGLELLKPAGEGGLAHMDLLGGVADRTGIGHRDQRPDEHQVHM